MMGNVPFFLSAIGSGVLFAIVLAVINTMLMAARDQSRDVGLLKALGFDSSAIFVSILAQSVLLSVLGGAAGAALAHLAGPPIRDMLGMMFSNFDVPASVGLQGVGLALLIGLIAGIAPSIRLARLPCITSLRGEALA
jgi:putative ABC transport system permease protein